MSHIRGIQKGKAKILEQFILYVGVFCCIIRYRELECNESEEFKVVM